MKLNINKNLFKAMTLSIPVVLGLVTATSALSSIHPTSSSDEPTGDFPLIYTGKSYNLGTLTPGGKITSDGVIAPKLGCEFNTSNETESWEFCLDKSICPGFNPTIKVDSYDTHKLEVSLDSSTSTSDYPSTNCTFALIVYFKITSSDSSIVIYSNQLVFYFDFVNSASNLSSPIGDFVISYDNDPYIGKLTPNASITSKGKISTTADSSNALIWHTSYTSSLFDENNPMFSITGSSSNYKLKASSSLEDSKAHNCTFAIIVYATYTSSETNQTYYSNQLAFYFNWFNPNNA